MAKQKEMTAVQAMSLIRQACNTFRGTKSDHMALEEAQRIAQEKMFPQKEKKPKNKGKK